MRWVWLFAGPVVAGMGCASVLGYDDEPRFDDGEYATLTDTDNDDTTSTAQNRTNPQTDPEQETSEAQPGAQPESTTEAEQEPQQTPVAEAPPDPVGGSARSPTCELREDHGCLIDPAILPAFSNDHVSLVTAFGDGVSTACVEVASPSCTYSLSTMSGNAQACLYGVAAADDSSFAQWGVQLSLYTGQFIGSDPNMDVPFDATEFGIVGFRLDVSGVNSRTPLRVGAAMFDETGAVAYTANPFWRSPDNTDLLVEDGTVTIHFDELVQPEWTLLDVDADGTPDVDVAFDPTRVGYVGMVVTTARGEERPYDFCVSNFSWIDASDSPVDVPGPPPP